MRMSDWSTDVCSSYLHAARLRHVDQRGQQPADHAPRVRLARPGKKGTAAPRDAEADIMIVRQGGEVGFHLHQYGADIGDDAGPRRFSDPLRPAPSIPFKVFDDRLDPPDGAHDGVAPGR